MRGHTRQRALATGILLMIPLAWWGAAGTMGCSQPADPPDGGGCAPGATTACTCAGGLAGEATCQADGTFGACACAAADAGPSDGGTDAGATDAGADGGLPDGGAGDGGTLYLRRDGGVVRQGTCCASQDQYTGECATDGVTLLKCEVWAPACKEPTAMYGYAWSVTHCPWGCRALGPPGTRAAACDIDAGTPGTCSSDGGAWDPRDAGVLLSDGGLAYDNQCGCSPRERGCTADGRGTYTCMLSQSSLCNPGIYTYAWSVYRCQSGCCVHDGGAAWPDCAP